MQIQLASHAHPNRTWPVLGIIGGGLTLLGGMALSAAGTDAGVALAFVGLLSAWSGLVLYVEGRTLARLDAVSLGTLAVPLPVLPARSAHPHRDVVQLPAGLPALVALPGEGWGLIPHDSASAALGRAGFDGRWHRIARPVEVWDPAAPVSTLPRLPRDADAVLVHVGDAVPHGVTGASIRAMATAPTPSPAGADVDIARTAR